MLLWLQPHCIVYIKMVIVGWRQLLKEITTYIMMVIFFECFMIFIIYKKNDDWENNSISRKWQVTETVLGTRDLSANGWGVGGETL